MLIRKVNPPRVNPLRDLLPDLMRVPPCNHVVPRPPLLDFWPAGRTNEQIEPFLGGGVGLEVVVLDVGGDGLVSSTLVTRKGLELRREQDGTWGRNRTLKTYRRCHLRVPNSSESTPSDIVVVLEQRRQVFRPRELLKIRWAPDTFAEGGGRCECAPQVEGRAQAKRGAHPSCRLLAILSS